MFGNMYFVSRITAIADAVAMKTFQQKRVFVRFYARPALWVSA
ncbi:hypothetical protein TDB9533_02319 [Thalassocella blandensis]|nr:hypothetical protein TDB9533_02319 [Thalassocella blandensis]